MTTRSDSAPPSTGADERPVEIAWLLVGAFDEVDRRAIQTAHEEVVRYCSEVLPRFGWDMRLVEMRDLAQDLRKEPSALLELGVRERDDRRCDFVLVITPADLLGHQRPHTRAVTSRSLAVAVLSTARIDPWASGDRCDAEARGVALTRRLKSLWLHVLGDLVGVEHRPVAASFMHAPRGVSDLDEMTHYDERTLEALRRELVEVADARLEEERSSPRNRPAFFVVAMFRNLRTIVRAVVRIRPWLFPLRLGKLTAAAVSTTLVLMTTAEAWDLAASNSLGAIMALAVITLVATTTYLIHRQSLILGGGAHLTEQAVVTRASVVSAVVLGLLTTYVVLLLGALGFSHLMFSQSLVEAWVSSVDEVSRDAACTNLSAMVATLGLLIGAMGASFERQHDIRHAAYVDEET